MDRVRLRLLNECRYSCRHAIPDQPMQWCPACRQIHLVELEEATNEVWWQAVEDGLIEPPGDESEPEHWPSWADAVFTLTWESIEQE
jgi:hypothetical protein